MAHAGDRAAAGTTNLWQRGNWQYLQGYADERILAILETNPADGTSAAAEKHAAKIEAIFRKLIRNDLYDPQYE
jgi:hypothetical protein